VVSVDSLAGILYVSQKQGSDDAEEMVEPEHFWALQHRDATSRATRRAPLCDQGLLPGLGLHYADHDILGTTLLVAPRIGVAFPLGETTSLWIRGGATYWHHKLELISAQTNQTVSPGGEVLFVLSPAPHFAFTLGLVARVGMGQVGAHVHVLSVGNQSKHKEDLRMIEMGLTFGALVYF